MNVEIAPIPNLIDLPIALWVALTSILLTTALLGFQAGCMCTRRKEQDEEAVLTPKERLLHNQRFEQTIGRLQEAQRACEELSDCPADSFDSVQAEQLETERRRLIDLLAQALAKVFEKDPQTRRFVLRVRKGLPLWKETPTDIGTGLPNRIAFAENLEAAFASKDFAGSQHGLLLIQIDKFDHLVERFGQQTANRFLRTLCQLARHQLRPQDLLAQTAGDRLAVVLPNANREETAKLADLIRRSVRNHRFSLAATGAEVLVTASFGLSLFSTSEPLELATSAAEHALEQARRQGRNQLEIHEAATATIS